jgi:hypothetical protein
MDDRKDKVDKLIDDVIRKMGPPGPPRDPGRIDPILELIGKVWKKSPDMRLMQLLLNVLGQPRDSFYLEDGELIGQLQRVEKNGW